jgi:hypothetical protein
MDLTRVETKLEEGLLTFERWRLAAGYDELPAEFPAAGALGRLA